MLNFKKLKGLIGYLPAFKWRDIQSMIYKVKLSVHDIKIKLANLSKTNFDLGLYHFEKGNISDAIFRFKLLRRFDNGYEDLDYLLGRCYLEQSKYDKAKFFLNMYIASNKPKLKEEAIYCMKIVDNDVNNIKSIPAGIVNHRLNQEFDFYAKAAQAFKKADSKNIIYDNIIEALQNNEKIFNYNMLELGCGSGLVPYILRKNQLLHFVLGVDDNENMVDYCKELAVGSDKVYNAVYHQNIEDFLASKSQSDSQFDIILGMNLTSYSMDSESLLIRLKDLINKNGVMVVGFYSREQNEDCAFERKLERFVYNENYVAEIAKKCGWQVIKQETIPIKKEKYSQVIMTLKRN
jgi:predicted TPR repeat methyltransferase